MAIKEVEFNGDVLVAVQDKTSEKVYVAVRWVVEGIGLTKGQMQNERKRMQEDVVLSIGERNLVLPTNGGTQEVQCIELNFLPLWLAKISLTPSMKKKNPETVNKLVEYQLKDKDVLANAFVHNVTQIVPKTYKEALLAMVESIEEKERLEELNKVLIPKAEVYEFEPVTAKKLKKERPL